MALMRGQLYTFHKTANGSQVIPAGVTRLTLIGLGQSRYVTSSYYTPGPGSTSALGTYPMEAGGYTVGSAGQFGTFWGTSPPSNPSYDPGTGYWEDDNGNGTSTAYIISWWNAVNNYSNGADTVANINGSNYSYAGGTAGVNATQRTDIVTLPGTQLTLTYTISSGGSLDFNYVK